MIHRVKAVYENGVLKLEQPLPLKEQERVEVVIDTEPSVAKRSYGLMEWKGSREALEYLAESPDLDPAERGDDLP